MSFKFSSLAKNKTLTKLTKKEFLVLLALKNEELHGYGIMKKINNIPGLWNVKSGSLYPLLKRLEEKKLITSEEDEGKKEYTLTEEGVKRVNDYLSVWNEVSKVIQFLT